MSASTSGKKPSIQECDRILTGPGQILEVEEAVIRGQRLRTYKQCPKTYQSFFLESLTKYSDRTFLSSPTDPDGREYLTFGDVLERSLELAAWFRSRGLGMGSRIVIGGGNSAGWIISFVAVQLIGGIAVALNAWLHEAELQHCLNLTEPALVLVDARLAEILDPLVPGLRRKGVGPMFCWSSLSHLSKLRHTRELWPNVNPSQAEVQKVQNGDGLRAHGPDSDAIIFFTSGTGGPPKAVLSTNRMALTNLWSGLVAPSRAALRAGLPIPPQPQPTDKQRVVLLSIPLFHVTGCLSWLMRAFTAGSKMVMMRRWDLDEAVRLIEAENITVIGGVPAVVNELVEATSLKADRSFETVFYGGAPPSRELAKSVKTRWPKAGLVQGYGLTETNAYVCSVAGTDYVNKPESTGPAVPVSDIRIINPKTNKDVATGHTGLLMVRGPQVMKCYFRNDKATWEVLDKDGWLNTGDMAAMDEEGFVYIKDRMKDIIIRGGENIASSEVENALYSHQAVFEAAAIGVPDKRLGEKVGAVVYLRKDGASQVKEEDLIKHVSGKIRRQALPSIILILDQPLPRNINGKIVKKDLKAVLLKAWEERGRVDAGPVRSKL